MTVQTETSRSGPYAGSGTTGPFTVSFRFLDNTHLQVIRTSSSGIDTTLVLTTDYSVSGAGGSSGTVTLVTALAVGELLTVIRDVPFTQLADYVDNDAFPADSHENALDLLTMQTQQNREVLDRSLTLPATVSGVSTELPSPSSQKVIAWNAAGTALENVDANTLASIVAYGTAVGDLFSGTGAQTAFTLTQNPASINNLDVSIGGVAQRPGIDYTWTSGTTLTFTTAPVAGTNNILVRYMQALSMGSGSASDIQYLPAGTGSVATDVQTQLRSLGEVADTFTALRALKKSTGKTATVLGASTKNDGGGGNYYYDSTDTTSTDNGDSVIVATDGGIWKRQPNKTSSGKVTLGYRPLQTSGLAYATEYASLIPAFTGLAWGGFPEYGACFDNDGYLWVPLHGSYSTAMTQAAAIPGGAAKIDTVTGSIVGIWRPSSKALGFYCLACCPTTGEIWATDTGCIFSDIGEQVGHVYVINPVTLSTVNTTNCVAGEHPGHVIFDPSTTSMIVCNGEAGLLSSGAKINTLTKYNATTYANISTTASLGSGLTQSVYCPDDGYVWVTLYVDGTARPVNTSTMSAAASAIATNFGGTTGANPIGIAFDTVTRSLWTANNVSQNVTRINPLTQSTTMMVTGATHFDPYKIEFVPETGLLMLSNYSGSTDFIDPVSCSVIASINQNVAGYRANGAIHDPINACAWNLVNTGPNGPAIQRIQPPLNYAKRIVSAAVNAGGAAQSIPTGALTQVVFNSKDFDPTGCYSTSTNRFTPGVKGIFRIAANVFFGGLATTSTTVFLSIYKNGSQYKDGAVCHPATAGGSCGLSVDALVHTNLSTDYFEIYVYQDGGASVNTNGLSRLSYASCCQVSVGQVGDST